MKKQLTTVALLVLSIASGNAQNLPDWLGPVYFPSAQSFCSNSPWKLVFYDGFSGSSLDTTKWISFRSWKGMENSSGVTIDHDNWDGARYEDGHYIFKKENIVVSNGTVKLNIKHEPYSWKCSSCPGTQLHNEQYTSAALCTYYVFNGQNRAFNNGRFEFRARFPNFPQSFGTAWTWYGNGMGVNELDLAESNGSQWYGNPWKDAWLPVHWRNYTGNITYPTHAWGRRQNVTTNLAPYVLPYHDDENVVQDDNPPRYPHQSWHDFLWNTYFDFTQWHTYTTEWDSVGVSTYLDHQLISTLPKYYRWYTYTDYYNHSYTLRLKAYCSVQQGNYEVSKGFPYRTNSASQLRFTTGVGGGVHIDNSNAVYDMGALEMDYVKIWQRNPDNGYGEICTYTRPQIAGNTQICGTQQYSVGASYQGGTWGTNNDGVLITGTQNQGTTAIVQNNPNSPYNQTILSYSYAPAGCPEESSYFTVNSAVAHPMVLCSRNYYLFKEDFLLKVVNPIPGAQYEWEVSYGIFNTSNYYHSYGAAIRTPRIYHHGFLPYIVSWKLKVTTSCGSKFFYGEKDQYNYFAAVYSRPETYITEDNSAMYVEARFSEQDSVAYENQVNKIVSASYIEDEKDTVGIETMIANAYVESLDQYLYFESDTSTIMSKGFVEKDVSRTQVYPNPINKEYFTVKLSDKYNSSLPVNYRIVNLNGQEMERGLLSSDFIITPSTLLPGLYVLELTQGNYKEFVKVQY